VRAASRRQKWIDQAQSLNLYVAEPSGRKLDELYRLAWRTGCKTTYYLRSRSATRVEKSTLEGTDGRLNAVSVSGAAGDGLARSGVVREGGGGSDRSQPASVAGSLGGQSPPRSLTEPPRRGITVPAMAAVTLSGAGAACTTPDDPECEACQ